VISALATGGFEVRRAKPDDLLYELGLRSGDRILSLNGYMLDSYDDAEVAFTSLWSSLAETTYTLELLRGRDVRELNYEIIQLRQPPESIVE
jgi:type II secretory pathway component PulC